MKPYIKRTQRDYSLSASPLLANITASADRHHLDWRILGTNNRGDDIMEQTRQDNASTYPNSELRNHLFDDGWL